MTKLISCAETAKMIRMALKEAFPGIKFSVRTSTYSGGASISLCWTDGPNVAQVEAVTNIFKGAYFDGSIDYQGNRFAMLDGVRVSFGSDYIHTKRQHSRAACERTLARVGRRFGASAIQDARISGSDEYGYSISARDYDYQRVFNSELYKHSDRLRVAASKTAGKIVYLGNDGYSDVAALQA